MIAKWIEHNPDAQRYYAIQLQLDLFRTCYCDKCEHGFVCWPHEAVYEPSAMKRFCRNKRLGPALDRLAELSPLVFPDLFASIMLEQGAVQQ